MAEIDPTKSTVPPRFTSPQRDLTGKVFNRLTVIGFAGRSSDNKLMWLCRCECGQQTSVKGSRLIRGVIRSCGCLQREAFRTTTTKHGLVDQPEYWVWGAMVQRCTNEKNRAWKNYGGRGITVCDRWRESFAAFFADMGPRPTDAHTLERQDNDKGYCPENCCWATRTEQCRNQRKTLLVSHQGITRTLSEWSERTGIKYMTLYHRLKRGITGDRLFHAESIRWPRSLESKDACEIN